MDKVFSLFLPLALQNPAAQVIKVVADFALATWNTVAAHEILTVTGDVRILCIPKIVTTVTGATGTYVLGVEGETTAWIASTAVAAMTATKAWLGTTPAATFALTSFLDRIVVGGADVGYTIGTAAATAGKIEFYAWWEPLTPGSMVVAGAGGVL